MQVIISEVEGETDYNYNNSPKYIIKVVDKTTEVTKTTAVQEAINIAARVQEPNNLLTTGGRTVVQKPKNLLTAGGTPAVQEPNNHLTAERKRPWKNPITS